MRLTSPIQSPGLKSFAIQIHLARGNPDAVAWLKAQGNWGVTSIAWLEFFYGAQSKERQSAALDLLQNFETLHLTHEDQLWAMRQLLKHRLRAGVAVNDCLLASIVYRLQLPLFTHTIKDLRKLLPTALVIQPY